MKYQYIIYHRKLSNTGSIKISVKKPITDISDFDKYLPTGHIYCSHELLATKP